LTKGGSTVPDNNPRSTTRRGDGDRSSRHSNVKQGTSIGKVIDDVPVANFLKNGLKTAVYVIGRHSTDNTRNLASLKGQLQG
jgi:hypothetical protein